MNSFPQTAVYSSEEQRSALIDQVGQVVCEETIKVLAERYGRRMRALVLTGSISRGEPALLIRGQKINVLGDADFIAIFEERSALPETLEMQLSCRRAEAGIANRNLQCKIGISAVHPKFVQRLEPNIFTYELVTWGRVVWGDATVLCLVPPMTLSEIPLEDAWRTLCNRMIELLEVSCVTSTATACVPLEIQYRMVKLWLDMATSFLVFAGSYAPTYREREQALRTMAARSSSSDQWPFSLPQFSSAVTRASEWRISGADPNAHFSDWQVWQATVRYAQSLWRWELCQLTGSSPVASDRQLWQSWVDSRPTRLNIRGWLHVLRKRGWLRSIQQWPRWLKLARSASPRLWTYGTGTELFFQLPALLFDRYEDIQPRLQRLFDGLPELQCPRQDGDWRQLAADIAWNYNEFVVSTRS
jgi:hypothetical protein